MDRGCGKKTTQIYAWILFDVHVLIVYLVWGPSSNVGSSKRNLWYGILNIIVIDVWNQWV